LYSFIF